jgi:hypothetical protein
MKLVKHGKERSGPLAPVSRGQAPLWPLRRLQEDIEEPRLSSPTTGRPGAPVVDLPAQRLAERAQ